MVNAFLYDGLFSVLTFYLFFYLYIFTLIFVTDITFNIGKKTPFNFSSNGKFNSIYFKLSMIISIYFGDIFCIKIYFSHSQFCSVLRDFPFWSLRRKHSFEVEGKLNALFEIYEKNLYIVEFFRLW